MKRLLWLIAALFVTPAYAYTADELRGDCRTAEALYDDQKSGDPHDAIRSARCIAYVAGFADGFAVGDYLADKVGIRLNAFCLPKDADLSARLVRAVNAHLDRQPPGSTASTANLVAGALSRSFPCRE
ncbi:MAG: hypothetical protein F9K30_10390 [Dechloromonas sp.]|nr:MAG: hypothetical protein F9K30_10390 [Dechloromonas sp.]